MTNKNTTHFGFQTVTEDEKAPRVREVFDGVASNYDRMNDAMSLGIHRLWKHNFVRKIRPYHNMQVLDIAGGTGDIAFNIAKTYHKFTPQITISDINAAMLAEGQRRAIDQNLTGNNFAWLEADAEAIGLPDNSQDVYTVAFGVRNMTHLDKALADAHRVLRPGSQFLCLEFSNVPNNMLRRVYDLYSFNIVPQLGQMIAGDKDAYQYLVESIRQFPSAERFTSMINDAGFSNASFTRLSGGIVAIHQGWKL